MKNVVKTPLKCSIYKIIKKYREFPFLSKILFYYVIILIYIIKRSADIIARQPVDVRLLYSEIYVLVFVYNYVIGRKKYKPNFFFLTQYFVIIWFVQCIITRRIILRLKN